GILRNKFRMKDALALHVFNHLSDSRGVLTGYDQLKIGYTASVLSAHSLHGNSRDPHAPGQSAFEIRKQTRPREHLSVHERVCRLQRPFLFRSERAPDLFSTFV